MKSWMQLALLFAAVIGAAFLPPLVKSHVSAVAQYQPHEVEAAKESIALSLLGQLQLSIGDLMWLKSMEYLHVGQMQRMPTRAEEARGHMRRESTGTAAGLAHTEGLNMTLDSDRDFRGLLGRIERHVKPYRAGGHGHDDPVEIIPWYQLAVRLNPRLERLYTLGAFYMADFADAPGEAHDLLIAGIQANPQSWEIRAALGRMYVENADKLHLLDHHHGHDHNHDHDDDHHDHDHDHGHSHHHDTAPETPDEANRQAVRLLLNAVEIADAHRRDLAVKRQKFDDFQTQVFGETYYFLSRAYVALKEYDLAIAVADEGYEALGTSPSRSQLRVQKRIAERQKAGEQADPADLMALTRIKQKTMGIDDSAQAVLQEHEEEPSKPSMPISLLLGIPAPDEAALATLPALPDLAATVLMDIRNHPYETAQERQIRIDGNISEFWNAIRGLENRLFIESISDKDEPLRQRQHAVTPIGLYVSMGHFGFDFWTTMREQAADLETKGIKVDLANPHFPDGAKPLSGGDGQASDGPSPSSGAEDNIVLE